MTGDKKRGVLLLAGWYYPESVGGTEAYVHWLAKDLRRRGCDVRVAAPAAGNFEAHYEYDGVSVYRYPVEQVPGISEVRGEVPPRHFEVFARWLEREPPRIVHLHSMTRGCGFFHARHAREELHLPLVITVHVPGVVCARGTMMRWGTTPCDGEMRTYRCATCSMQAQGVPQIIGWPLSVASRLTSPLAIGLRGRVASTLSTGLRTARRHSRVRELFRIADRVVVVSQWLYESLVQNGVNPEKLVLIRHGLPDEYMQRFGTTSAQSTRKRLQIGFVGRINPVKGLGVLISAMRMLPLSIAVDLHVYGAARNDEDRDYLSRVRAAAGTDPRIIFHGEMTSSNRLEALRSLDMLAVPSVWLETGPLVVMEAFAAGLPVLGSNVGGIAELVSDGVSGRLVEVGNVTVWARVLRELGEQFKRGQWEWTIPPIRASHEVTEGMLEIYEDAWESFD